MAGYYRFTFLFTNFHDFLFSFLHTKLFLKWVLNKKKKKKKKKKRGPMGHNLITCLFANAMERSSSIATATGTQIWPYHKKVKGQPSLIILNLVDLESLMLYNKIHPQSFKCFYNIWAWQPSCSMMQNHLNKVPTSLPKKAPCEIWWKLVKWF